MRIRVAKFVQIPMWVLRHRDVRGNHGRLAAYAGLYAVHWEAPDMNWRSTREIAAAVGEMIDMPSETCRKHLSHLVVIGAIRVTNDDVVLPVDEPVDDTTMGEPVGHPRPTVGHPRPKPASTPISVREEDSSLTQLALGDLPQPDPFDTFWEVWPKRLGKGAARKAFERAMKRATIEQLLAGARTVKALWEVMPAEERQFVPYPERWLNGEHWLDELQPEQRERIEAVKPKRWLARVDCESCAGSGYKTIDEDTNTVGPCHCRFEEDA